MRTYGCEAQRMHLDTEGCDVFLLEFTRQVTLDEGCLYRTSVILPFLMATLRDRRQQGPRREA